MPPFDKSKFQKQPKNLPPRRKPRAPNNNIFFWLLATVFLVLLFNQSENASRSMSPQEMSYSEFSNLVKNNDTTHKITKVELLEGQENYLQGKLSDGKDFHLMMPTRDEKMIELLRNNVKDFSTKPAQSQLTQILLGLLPYLVLGLIIWFFAYRGSQMGNRIWAFGKSRAKLSTKTPVTFNDVAGVDEAKEELQEIIEFLKEPKKFQRLGGKIPRGVLLVGHPGTGKTLLAKAVAGEAEVPFFSLSGSDFVEMFVGVGASRVRDLFEQARKASLTSGKGAIVFIDEIDAVGRQRFSGIGGGNDEREQTLNALLVELDGFTPQTGVIVMAATNRPDTLDPALLRPGRFDRQIVVTLPDILGREGILKVHSKNLKISTAVNFTKLAQQTVYFSGADLANVCNEAALLAARKNKEQVEMDDFLAAIERVTMGPEKKSRTISKKEKTITAYHEAGHALLSLLIEEVDTFTKISIIPRGMAGGYTLTPPTEDKHYRSKKELQGSMTVLLGGLAGEEIYGGDTSTGVSNDLQRVTQIARAMVCEYGMSEKIGRLGFGDNQQYHFLGRDLLDHKDYSDQTARDIDLEVKDLVDQSYRRAKKILTDNQDKLKKIAEYLIEKEIIDITTARELLGIPEPLPETPPAATNSGTTPNTTTPQV